MLLPETKTIQNKLGEYCRTGEMPDIPGIHKTHIRHYRRLIFNVVSNNIRKAFPIAERMLGARKLREMTDEFLRNHDPRTNQVWKLPGEFYSYALEAKWNERFGLPWLNDLLSFEWAELRIFTMADNPVPEHRKEGDLLSDPVIFNPDFEILELAYPVHLYALDKTEENKGRFFVLIFRDLDEGKVHFIHLSNFFAFLLLRLTEKDTMTSAVVLAEAVEVFHITEPDKYYHAAQEFLSDLKKQGFLLGFAAN